MSEETNLTTLILDAINELFSMIFSSIDNTIYSTLDDITFINSNIISEENFQNILGQTPNEGILLVCNSLILGFIIYYAINYLISHLIYSKIDSPKQFIFKSIIFIGIMNSSYWICLEIINIISILTDLISNLSFSLFGEETTFSNFINIINQTIYSSNDGFNFISFDGFIKSFISFGFINLIFTYSLRYVMILIFVLISPFAFLSIITNSSEWFFRVWIKSFISLLLVQVLISLILLLAFSIPFDNNSNISKLLYIGIIYALTKANIYMKELFGGISYTVNTSFSKF